MIERESPKSINPSTALGNRHFPHRSDQLFYEPHPNNFDRPGTPFRSLSPSGCDLRLWHKSLQILGVTLWIGFSMIFLHKFAQSCTFGLNLWLRKAAQRPVYGATEYCWRNTRCSRPKGAHIPTQENYRKPQKTLWCLKVYSTLGILRLFASGSRWQLDNARCW